MKKLELTKDMKYGKQELLLDPAIKGNKCGYEVEPLLLNDLMVKKPDGTFVNAYDFIMQESISIEVLEVVAQAQSGTIRVDWIGDNKVKYKVDDGAFVNHEDTTKNAFELTLPAGQHKVFVQSLRDRRGLEQSFEVIAASNSITVEYN